MALRAFLYKTEITESDFDENNYFLRLTTYDLTYDLTYDSRLATGWRANRNHIVRITASTVRVPLSSRLAMECACPLRQMQLSPGYIFTTVPLSS